MLHDVAPVIGYKEGLFAICSLGLVCTLISDWVRGSIKVCRSLQGDDESSNGISQFLDVV